MKITELQPRNWYKINFVPDEPEKYPSYKGNGMFIELNPYGYGENTLKFLCEDGKIGFFILKDVVEATEKLNNNELNELVFKLSKK